MLKQRGRIFSVVISFVLIVTLCACSGGGSAKKAALDFTKALLDNADAKRAVSLMSEDLLAETLVGTECETEKVLISYLSEALKEQRDEYKEIEIKYVDQKEISNNCIEVYLSCTYTQEKLFSFSDEETTEKLTISLVKEKGKWLVRSF